MTIDEKVELIDEALAEFAGSECPDRYIDRQDIRQWLEKREATLGNGYRDNRLVIDPEQFLVMVDSKRIKLTATEHRLLACLVANAGRILTHKQILTSVWGWEYQDDIDFVRIYIWRLRHKLESDPSNPEYIISENGIGYYFKKRGDKW